MLWLFAQVWVWLIVALLFGVLAGWLFWARPLRREIAGLDREHTDREHTDRDARTA